ncbi:ComEC/Rec2 family competence protein, partial [Bacteroidota bacterium]
MNLNRYLFQYSIFKLLLPFIIGICIEINFQIYSPIFFYIITCVFLLLLFFNINRKISQTYKFRWFYGVAVNAFMILFGVLLIHLNQNKPENKFNDANTFIGIIDEAPLKKENSIKTIVKLVFPEKYKVLIYLEPSDDDPKLGDYLIFNTHLKNTSNTGNPHEFDYKKYLSFHNIHLQSYIKKENWTISKVPGPFQIRYYANNIRYKIFKLYQLNELTGKELNIISALTLGYKSNLSRETKEIFSKSGAIHILAVSGLHVGIIYLLFSFIFKFLDNTKRGRVLKSLIILILIWIYAFITGLSPSIQRASLMFSIIIFGNLLSKQNSVYQSLALSAFIILLINPYELTEIGFQLSYTAVFGIVYFQPRIFKLIAFKNPILSYLWALISVSIAAQITTFPLILYYFHQFPSLFIISNLVVVPFAFISIVLTISGIILSFTPAISIFLFKLIKILTDFIYTFLEFIQKQSYSVIEDIYFIEPHLILTFLLIIFLSIFFIQKSGKYVVLS